MIRWLAVFAVIQMSVYPACAENISIRGAGAMNCTEWTKAHDGQGQVNYVIHVQWVMGFLSGFSYFRDKSLLKHSDQDAVSAYVDDKCKLKPGANIVDIAVDLGNELAK